MTPPGEIGRILVTGANGHLGRRLIERALDAGAAESIQAVVRSERAASTLAPLRQGRRLDVAIVDYGDANAICAAAEGCTHVVHLVGILKEAANTRYEVAHEGITGALARAAAKAGARRVVYLSILGADTGSPNPCLASKARAERLLLDAEVPAVVLRVPMVLGRGDVAARALEAQARGSLVPLVRGGACYEQPIDAEDVLEAILRSLSLAGLGDEVLDLAGPESLPHRELVRRAARLCGSRPRFLPVPLALVRAFAAIAERVLANPPLTRAMLEVLEHDDRIDPAPACQRLSLELTPLETTLRRCLGEKETA
jgi:NADH dehydrogenase